LRKAAQGGITKQNIVLVTKRFASVMNTAIAQDEKGVLA